jgi:ketosteroid isomerase-like protein
MSVTEQNKQLMQTIYTALASGDRRPFRDRMADNIQWTIIGSTKWSGTHVGREAVSEKLFRPLFALFADTYTNTAHRVLADGEYVVVESRGKVTTKAGKPYHNHYCQVFRLLDSKIVEVVEYCDTALIDAAL